MEGILSAFCILSMIMNMEYGLKYMITLNNLTWYMYVNVIS